MSDDKSNPPNRALYDPGWNDPPMFSYSAAPPSAHGRTKLNLNKRVAFPLQSNTDTQSQQTQPQPIAHSSGLPLPLTGTGRPPLDLSLPHSPPMMSMIGTGALSSQCTPLQSFDNQNLDGLSEEEMRKYYLNIFEQSLKTLQLNNENEVDEISKRLEILKSNLLEKKLNSQIEYILYKIGNSIENQNISEATNLHRILVVDHLNSCSQWSAALRKLILLLEPVNVDAHTSSEIPHHLTDKIPMMESPCDLSTSATNKNFSKIYHI